MNFISFIKIILMFRKIIKFILLFIYQYQLQLMMINQVLVIFFMIILFISILVNDHHFLQLQILK